MNEVWNPNELYHHGIKGQKWGIRRYQNQDGSYTEEGRRRYLADQTKGLKRGTDKYDRVARRANAKYNRVQKRAVNKKAKQDYRLERREQMYRDERLDDEIDVKKYAYDRETARNDIDSFTFNRDKFNAARERQRQADKDFEKAERAYAVGKYTVEKDRRTSKMKLAEITKGKDSYKYNVGKQEVEKMMHEFDHDNSHYVVKELADGTYSVMKNDFRYETETHTNPESGMTYETRRRVNYNYRTLDDN